MKVENEEPSGKRRKVHNLKAQPKLVKIDNCNPQPQLLELDILVVALGCVLSSGAIAYVFMVKCL